MSLPITCNPAVRIRQPCVTGNASTSACDVRSICWSHTPPLDGDPQGPPAVICSLVVPLPEKSYVTHPGQLVSFSLMMLKRPQPLVRFGLLVIVIASLVPSSCRKFVSPSTSARAGVSETTRETPLPLISVMLLSDRRPSRLVNISLFM